jgi:hypothetical protein
MRKLLIASTLALLPVLGMATVSPASAAAPGNMTLLDKLSTAQSSVDQVRHRCYRRSTRVCTKRILGKCVRHRTRTWTHCPRHR